MAQFIKPKLLTNATSDAIDYDFDNAGENHCLFEGCEDSLPSGQSYDPKQFPNSSPTTYGLYLPVVGDQEELDANFGELVTSEGNKLMWFELHDDLGMILVYSDYLVYGEGTPVMTTTGGYITPSIFDRVRLIAEETTGGVIILGILDTGTGDGGPL
jgi:hypothetical protein